MSSTRHGRRITTARAPDDHLAPVYAQFPLDVVDATACYLHTRDGRRVLDLYGGHAVAALGYGHPRWLAALADAGAARCCSRATRCRSTCARAPRRGSRGSRGCGLDTVFFVNTGAEANENALKLALKIDRRAARSSRSKAAFTAARPRPAP